MSCCGKKRAEWLSEIKAVPPREIPESVDSQNEKEYKSKVFEYMGNQSLILKGTNSGRIYHFQSPGEKIEVAYEDSFAMMAERDLRSYK